MKGLSFFSHDVNARFDRKIRKLRKKYGSDALLFWDLLEEMGDSDGYYPLADIEFLSTDLDIDDKRKQEIIEYAIEIGLFVKTDEDEIYSQRLTQFMQDFSAKSQKASAAAKSKGKDNKDDDNEDDNAAKQTQSERKTNDEQTQSERKTNDEQTQSERKAKKERKEEKKETTTTEKKAAAQMQSDVVVAPPTQSVTTCNESVTDCHQLQNMSNEQIAGAMALLDSIGIDIDSLPQEEAAADKTDTDSILFDDNAVFNPDDNVGDYNTLQQQEADNAAAVLLDDKARMRDTLINTYHISESVADVELAMHEVQYIQSKIDLLSKQKGINNPGAWLLKAIENDYQVAAVPEEKPLPQQTKTFSDNQYERFCQHFQQVYKHEFDQRALYESAANILGSESKVDYLLTVINEYRGDQRIVDIFKVNHLACFADLLRSETAMGAMIGFGMAQGSKDMANKIKELPWMRQNKQGA